LFRKLSQNERSLFAFLCSNEFYSFKNFLDNTFIESKTSPPLFNVDNLYDYVVSSIGSGLYINHNGKVWAEIEHALSRINKDELTEIRIIKTIGLLNAVGNFVNIKATFEVINYCLCEKVQTLKEKLNALIARGIIVD